jgi:hypothetical protein
LPNPAKGGTLEKGRPGGILQIEVVTILRILYYLGEGIPYSREE